MVNYVSQGMSSELITAYDARSQSQMYPIHKGTIAAIAAGFVAFCEDMEIHTITNWLNTIETADRGFYLYAEKIKKGERYLHYLDADTFMNAETISKARIIKKLEVRQSFLSAIYNVPVPEIQRASRTPAMNKQFNVHYWVTESADNLHTVHYIEEAINEPLV